ncbi:hypothetical protein BDF21DRAFT_455367 [Thamnidium elegans]|nr:hypothetical protein BDF21DRAFT_455367 [Thamnidium elegans]
MTDKTYNRSERDKILADRCSNAAKRELLVLQPVRIHQGYRISLEPSYTVSLCSLYVEQRSGPLSGNNTHLLKVTRHIYILAPESVRNALYYRKKGLLAADVLLSLSTILEANWAVITGPLATQTMNGVTSISTKSKTWTA